jgi:general secretion pathway protein A
MNMTKRILTLYGAKWLPFGQDVPDEGLYVAPRVENFALRVIANINEGGYALCTGEPGQGKSVVSRVIARRIGQMDGVRVGCIDHPQSRVSDFYRELGDLFDIQMNIYNRFSGFKALRSQWLVHIDSTLVRPVLLVDEAQDMAASAFTELRTLSSKDFDSRCLLTVVFFGDNRLIERFRTPELVPLASRIRTRLHLEPAQREELRALLEHRMEAAGVPQLMTPELVVTLCDRAGGNARALLNMAAELLYVGAEKQVERLDEKLFLDVFAPPIAKGRPVVAAPALVQPAKGRGLTAAERRAQ